MSIVFNFRIFLQDKIFSDYFCIKIGMGTLSFSKKRITIFEVLDETFFYAKKNWAFHVFFSLIYLSVYFSVTFYFAYRYGVIEEISSLMKNIEPISVLIERVALLGTQENIKTFSLIVFALQAFLFPLHVGLFKIYKKTDLKETIGPSDLFSGYSGVNFFIFVSYFILWKFMMDLSFLFFPLAFLWILFTLLATPLMFFKNLSSFRAISLSFKATIRHIFLLFLAFILSLFFRYAGFLLFVFGLFTYPVIITTIYVLYKKIFEETSYPESQT
ncbi:MAG: hypothetical protein FDW93_05295 [Bergeyella sp.]|nr:hypothetical protein [Bergeyella sp.]